MTIHQVSVFLENKLGQLNEVLALVAHENIRIISASLADTSEFGLLRIIATDPHKAYRVFKRNGINAYLTEVLAIVTDASSAEFAQIIEHFTQSGISVEYMYYYLNVKKGIWVVKLNDWEAALEVVRKKGLVCISEGELMNL
jgi:hypothetical protein